MLSYKTICLSTQGSHVNKSYPCFQSSDEECDKKVYLYSLEQLHLHRSISKTQCQFSNRVEPIMSYYEKQNIKCLDTTFYDIRATHRKRGVGRGSIKTIHALKFEQMIYLSKKN